DHNQEVGRRIRAAWATFHWVRLLLRNKRMPMFVKRRYYQQCIAPALLYASAIWVLTNTMETRLTRFQRAIERRFLGVWLKNKHPNQWIRKRTSASMDSARQKTPWAPAHPIFGRLQEAHRLRS